MVRYTEFIPKRGDFGFVAWHEETPVGIVWALFLPRERHGWGFVESATPKSAYGLMLRFDDEESDAHS